MQRLLGVFIRSFYFNHPLLGLPGDTADISLNLQSATSRAHPEPLGKEKISITLQAPDRHGPGVGLQDPHGPCRQGVGFLPSSIREMGRDRPGTQEGPECSPQG